MTVSRDVHLRPAATSGAEALPVVLVHGYLGGSAQWSDLEAALAGRFRTVAIDLPGFGRASRISPPTSIEGFAEHVIADLDAMGIDRFNLVGHSMGGMIAQEIARRIAPRIGRLVLYGTGPIGSMPDRFEPIGVSLDRLLQDGVAVTARRIAATWLLHGEAHPAFATLSAIGAQADPWAAQTALTAMAAWDGRAGLPMLTMPSLVIWGDRDRSYRWAQVEQLWTNLPAASLAVIPGASHAAHAEKPQIFRLILEDFLLA
ncbi:alpha/beta fold hydrolase [Roseicyclus persicicus]|uniref:Alpha/beta fold hydrolase n=1 Tax=Roseicyclus persicicus TaxID=2650661 RepID=A0A7X6H2G1_9RHOB|nr:alpha/beta fold hydrolase [Roseibacterium persicicum]NKX45953.1 alpha/beta fold hydrolase [Roseibacterium persicicum]